ncbi:MAG: hypothetical protein MUP15_00455 [Dehalococcoidia bacterium]|nr:hypothetical protein [Dehalococcoidia bacterium]
MREARNINKGRSWEYRVHRAVFLSGWFARRNINLRELVHGSPQTMAEIDIFAIDFDASLTPQTLVGECKNRKGGAKEADRVIWLMGVKQVLRCQHLLFAKPTIAGSVYSWARPYNVLLWDEAAIQDVEQRFGVSPTDGYIGSYNVDLIEGEAAAALKTASTDVRFRRAHDFIANSFWYSGNSSRAKRLPAYFEVLSQVRRLSPRQTDFLVAEGLIALLVSALLTAGLMQRISPARAVTQLMDGFASGAASATVLREIAGRADDYYRDALARVAKTTSTGVKPMDIPRLVDHVAQPPSWLTEYLSLARQVSESPTHATQLLRLSDLLLFERMVYGNESVNLSEFVSGPVDELLRLVQLAAHFLRRVWHVEAELLERLLALEGVDAGKGEMPAQQLVLPQNSD